MNFRYLKLDISCVSKNLRSQELNVDSGPIREKINH